MNPLIMHNRQAFYLTADFWNKLNAYDEHALGVIGLRVAYQICKVVFPYGVFDAFSDVAELRVLLVF